MCKVLPDHILPLRRQPFLERRTPRVLGAPPPNCSSFSILESSTSDKMI